MIKGIDFSFGGGLTTAQIKAAGYEFVARYLSGGNSKDISAAELKNYKAAGIPVIFVWETTGTDMTSEANGVNDAKAAQAELDKFAAANADASLKAAPVFFAADEQTESALVPYMTGVVSVLGKARSGIYGGVGSVSAAFNAGVVTYGWQTSAWSAGNWDWRAILRQVGYSLTVGPASCDLDEAGYWAGSPDSAKILTVADDFGQWPRPSAVAPSPAPAPAPAPKVVGGLKTSVTVAVRLSWNAVPGATTYHWQVFRSAQANQANLVQEGNSPVAVTVEGLSANSEYWFRVGADNAGWSALFPFRT